MKRRDVRQYLYDIVEACVAIREFAHGKTFDEYAADRLLRSGVERQLTIAAEALNRALRAEPDLAEGIHGVADIIAFRNVVVHEYDVVSNEVVWGIVVAHVPLLEENARDLLDELDRT